MSPFNILLSIRDHNLQLWYVYLSLRVCARTYIKQLCQLLQFMHLFMCKTDRSKQNSHKSSFGDSERARVCVEVCHSSSFLKLAYARDQ